MKEPQNSIITGVLLVYKRQKLSTILQETETVYYEKQLLPIRCSPTHFSRTDKTADPAYPPSARCICQPSRHGDHMGFYQFGRTLAEASIHSVKEVNRRPIQSKEFHTKALGTGFTWS